MKSAPCVEANHTTLIATLNFLPSKKFKSWFKNLEKTVLAHLSKNLRLLFWPNTPTENWVTVSPKKRVRPAPGLKPQDPPILDTNPSYPPMAAQSVVPFIKVTSRTCDPAGIILANPTDMKNQGEGSSNIDTLNAVTDDDEERMDAYENANMFLNLENIEDVEMSTDSSKRKRVEEAEECNSHT